MVKTPFFVAFHFLWSLMQFLINPFSELILCHYQVVLALGSWFQKSTPLRYMEFTHLTHNVSFFAETFQICFHAAAWFQAKLFLMFKPPLHLGLYTLSHATSGILLLFAFPAHKKSRKICCTSSVPDLGKMNIPAQYT